MKQHLHASFPNFRNLGVVLRTLVLVQALRLTAFMAIFPEPVDVFRAITSQGALFEPILLSAVALLALLSPGLQRLSYVHACALALSLSAALAVLWHVTVQTYLQSVVEGSFWHSAWVALIMAALVLFYFNWRHHRLSPAWSEARLMALQARIQPHFLFNSLNSVLSLIRVDPGRAETMLEDLCDLYRSLLGDSRQLVPLSQELELARTYVQIESIRFGPRLQVHWQCDTAPAQALVPPLLLQPLLENAVRYGVEPQEQGATIGVEVRAEAGQLLVRVCNPVLANPVPSQNGTGNHMALDNLRERLALHFDAEAALTTSANAHTFEVQVRLPVRLA